MPHRSLRSWCLEHNLFCFATASALCVLVLYWGALSAPFVYDDLDQIVNNPSLHSWHAMFARFFLAPVAFTTEFLGRPGGSTYRPLYWLTLEVDRQLWGPAGASGFHLTNLLLHWLNGALLFQLLKRFSLPVITAASASFVWLILPIQTEAVAWVSGRAYPLSTMFVLASLILAHAYCRRKKLLALAGFTLLASAAVLSHEQGILLLPLLILLIWRTRVGSRRSWFKLATGSVAVDLLYVGARLLVGVHSSRGSAAPWAVGLEFWKYLLWMAAPIQMSVERSTSQPPDVPSLVAIAAWVALLAFISAAFLLRKRAPTVATGLGWGFITLVPFCGIVYVYQGMAERFLYLASAGVVLALVSFVIDNRRLWKGTPLLLLLLWLGWSVWRLVTRVRDWADPIALYSHSAEATPRSAILFYNLGFSLREKGDPEGALAAYRHAVSIRPDYEPALASIGDIHAARGAFAAAINDYDRALRLRPDDTKVLLNDAVAFEQIGDAQRAEQDFKHVISLAPQDSAAYVDLGGLYVQQQRQPEAIQYFEEAIRKNPADPDAYFNLAVTYQKAGRDDLALPLYKQVLVLKPNDPDTLLNISALHVH